MPPSRSSIHRCLLCNARFETSTRLLRHYSSKSLCGQRYDRGLAELAQSDGGFTNPTDAITAPESATPRARHEAVRTPKPADKIINRSPHIEDEPMDDAAADLPQLEEDLPMGDPEAPHEDEPPERPSTLP
ncbi:hypothetical protein FRC07_007476, partial [Ceratobasidium sp. 392]